MNRIFRELLRLAIDMKLNKLLSEDLEDLLKDLLLIRRLQHGEGYHDGSLRI